MQASIELARLELEMGLISECMLTLERSDLLDVQQIDSVSFYKMTDLQVCMQALNDEAAKLYFEACTRRYISLSSGFSEKIEKIWEQRCRTRLRQGLSADKVLNQAS